MPLDRSEFLWALDMIWSAVFPSLIFQGVLVVVVGECRGRQGVFRLEGAYFGHGDKVKFGYCTRQGLIQ